MAQTTTKTQQPQQNAMRPQNAVAVLAPPRLLPPEQSILQQYGVDNQGWRTLVDSIFPGAKTTMSVVMALDYCARRKLDVYKHPVHVVAVWNSQAGENGKGAMVEAIWPGINELRTTAMRTGQFAGMDVPVFGPMIDNRFEGRIKKWVNGSASWEKVEAHVIFPEWCQITVYRTLGTNRVPFPGPRVYWLETYARIRNDCDVPNSMWEKRANGQIEKCAEAAALRRAFPEEIGSDYSIDEIGAFTTHAPTDITDQVSATTAPVSEPKRDDPKYQSQPDAPPSQGAPAESGQPATSPPAGASSVRTPEVASQPAPKPKAPKAKPPHDEKVSAEATKAEQVAAAGVTDVEDQNATTDVQPEFGPERPRPGEKLDFMRYSKVVEFCNFADFFLPRTNAEGAAQFEAQYDGTLIAMERGKKGSQDAAKEYRDMLAKFRASGREPGEEG